LKIIERFSFENENENLNDKELERLINEIINWEINEWNCFDVDFSSWFVKIELKSSNISENEKFGDISIVWFVSIVWMKRFVNSLIME
jgi:hypothetical protein